MKNLNYLFLLLACILNAQEFERKYVNAEIYFHGHESVKGYIYDEFIQNDNYGEYDFKQNAGWSANTGGS